MPNIADIKQQYPDLDGLDDNQIVDVLHGAYYADMPREKIAGLLGVKPAPEPEKPRSWGAVAKDVGISALKGAIGVPEAAVGIADMVSGGQAGKLAEEAGFRPKDAKAILDQGYSDQQKAAFQKVQAAEGFGDTFMTAVQNPSVVGHSVIESIPLMGAGGVVGRGVMAVAPRIGAVGAGALGEGAIGAGSAAEQIRQQTPDGLLTGGQAGLAGATGVLTSGFSLLGGKIAQKLGIADVDTMLAGAATNPAMKKGVVRSALEGALSEGVLEELPQSVSEQVLQNAALGKPLDEGVDQAAVLGLLSGGVMGAGANAYNSFSAPPAPVAPIEPPAPPAGPLSRAAGLALPAPVITVNPMGEALTAADRSFQIQPRGNLAESGLMGMGRDSDITDIESRDVPLVPPAPPPAPRTERRNTDGVNLDLPTDPVQNYIEDMRAVNTPAAKLYVRDFDAGTVTPADVAERMAIEQGKTPDERIAAAASEAPTQTARPGDILNPKGQPFKTRFPADRTAKAEGGTVIAVPGGYAVRQTSPKEPNVQDTAPSTNAAPATAQAAASQAPAPASTEPAAAPGVPAVAGAGNVEAAGLKGEKLGEWETYFAKTKPAADAAAAAANLTPEESAGIEAEIRGVLARRKKHNTAGQNGKDAHLIRADLIKKLPRIIQQSATPSATSATPNATGDIKAITAKQIPDMTDDEIRQAITHYGPDHARTAKLNAALTKRGTTPGATNEPQANQAQPQQTQQQAGAASVSPATNPLKQVQAVNEKFKDIQRRHGKWFTGEGTARTLDANAPQNVRDEWTAYQAEKKAAQAAMKAPSTPNTGVSPNTGEDTPVSDTNDQWQRTPTADREGMAVRAGVTPLVAQNIAKRPWDEITAKTRRKLLDIMEPAAPSTPANAIAPVDTPAAPVDGNLTTSAADQRSAAAAAEVKRRAAGKAARQRAHEANPFRAFIGKHGITLDVRSDFAPGVAEQRKAMVQGYGPIFRNAGLKLDDLAQRAVEEGFLLDEDVPKLESMISDVLMGNRVIAQYAEGVAENEMEQRIKDMKAQYDDELAGMTDEDFDSASQNEADAEALLREDTDAMLFELSDDETLFGPRVALDELTGKENAQTQPGTGKSPQDSPGAAQTATGKAPGTDGQGNAAPGTDQGLTAPSAAEVVAAQDRAEKAERTAKAKRLADAELERQERIRKDIKKASEAAADTFTLGGDAEQNLSGQGGMFDDAPPAAPPAPKTPSADAIKAKNDLMDALADLGDIFNKPFKANITPEQEQKLLPVLTRVLDAAFRMGYMKFKDAAKFALDQIKTAFGADVADALTLDHMQGAYIAMAGGKPGADTKRAVIDIEDKAEIEGHTAQTDAERAAPPPAPPAAERQDTVLRSAPGVPGTEYHLIEKARGYAVSIMDTERSQYMPVLRAFSGPNALKDATKYFEDVAPQAARLSDSLLAAIRTGNMPKDNPALKRLVEAFDGKPADPARMKQAQEHLETAIAMAAREVVAKNEGDRSTYDALLRLYESQPNLNIRTSTSIANQAYSTPAPLAFLASRLAGITSKSVAHEPTAGTGMLLIGADPKKAIVNELNDLRIDALKAQGFTPTQKDAATELLVADNIEPDAVITNPPFGSIKDQDGKPTKVQVDGYNIGQIDHLIAARALETMKDDGKATLIIGANKVAGELSTDDRIFFNWLYSHYNVTGHFEVDGGLYTRQGAGWPVRVIRIEGRAASKNFAPVAGTIQRADNWNQVYEQYTQTLKGSNTQTSNGATPAADPAGGTKVPAVPAPSPAGGRRPQGGTAGSGNVAGGITGNAPDSAVRTPPQLGGSRDEQRLNAQSDGAGTVPGGKAGTDAKPAGSARPGNPAGAPALTDAPDATGNEFQVPYTPRSARKDEGVLIPSNMAQPLQDALSRLEDEVGDIDEYARAELGYDTVEDLHGALMGLQVDSVAMSIWQMKNDKAVVIADQTGIGKGRQAAAIIRWAARNGHTPVFISYKPSLFTDMYGDLADIGTDDVNPFIMNSTEWITGADGSKLFANKAALHRRAIEQIATDGTLPEGRNAVFMTYSQINVPNKQRTALTALAPNAVFVLDEAHNAAGASATGQFMIDTLGLAKGVTYLSATYAKRPDNMPLYFKTDIGAAAADTDGLAVAMASGGLPLQTVVSNNLVKAGQMFRRERSYNGVSIASMTDAANRTKHEAMSDQATTALRAIVEADRMFHDSFVKTLQEELAQAGATVQDNAGNQMEKGVQHTEFSSVVHNFIKQMLLGLKAQTAADEAIAALKRGEKPIIAVENTMGSFLNEYAGDNSIKQGDSLGAYDYRVVLTRALARSRVITEVDDKGNKNKRPVPMSELDALTRLMYEQAQEVIDGLKLDIPASPIDWIRAEITKAGYSVAEITGRNLTVDYTDPANLKLSAIDALEQNDKVNTTRQFNSGKLDALILNVAGSTGISLHASEKFTDQRQRYMIVAQAAGDINTFMQMLGRIHRTGQVVLPKYALLSVDLPTEKRPTAVLSGKMKSLNANTSSNTESATSVQTLDLLNKYGDQIVNQFLLDNVELARALDVVNRLGDDPMEDIARMATGRLALQPIAVQMAFYEEVEAQYSALIDYLNKTNQNDLEPRTFDFDAKEIRQEVLFDGPDPTTPFGEDAVYGEYSIKAQGKPMTPAEIKAAMAESLAGKTGIEHANALTESLLQTHADDMNAKRREMGLDSSGTFDEVKYYAFVKSLYGENAAMAWVNNAKKQLAEGGKIKEFTADDMRDDGTSYAGMQFIKDHAIGRVFRVDINGEPFNAIITNLRNTHKGSGNPFSLSKIQLTISVNGALRSLSVPGTQFKKIEVSSVSTFLQVEQLFKEQPPNQRETAKIVTGNLLAAYGELQGTRGTIISFTKQDGSTEQGILLPKLFDYTKNTRGDYRLPTPAAALKFLQNSNNPDIGRFGIMSRDSVVRVIPRGRGIRVSVPKSKLKGGKFFLDKGLIEAGGEDFVSSGQSMTLTVFEPQAAVKVLELLIKKQALYALPSMADEAKTMSEGDTSKFSRVSSLRDNKDIQPILQQLITMRRKEVDATIKEMGLDGAKQEDRLSAAESILSTMMKESPQSGFAKRAIAATTQPTRRDFLIAAAAASASSATKAETTLGKARPLSAAALSQALPPGIAKLLRGNGATSLEGAKAIGAAMREIAANGPAELRALARQIADQLPAEGVMLTVDDRRVMNAHGAVSWSRGMPHMQLFTAGGRTGMTYGTFLHESLHLVVLAKYKTLNSGMVRGNDAILKAPAPAASKELAQLSALMDEFAIAAKANPAKDEDTRLSVSEAVSDPDEFFVRALTDPRLQAYMAGIEYQGRSLLQRFKDWVKGIFTKSGVRPSWLDAALLASQELTAAMGGDDPNFKRMKVSGALSEKREAVYSRASLSQSLAGAVSSAKDVKLPAGYLVGDFFNDAGKLSWWHKSVGTMYNLAQRNPRFKKVYDGVQDFLNDVSFYATEAADLAPNILPKLDTWKDITKTPLSPEDNKAIAAPIFEGTLNWGRDDAGKPVKMDVLEAKAAKLTPADKAQELLRKNKISQAVLKMWQGLPVDQYDKLVNARYESQILQAGTVFTKAELKSLFTLNDGQVKLYQEFRAAIDKSLTTLALSDMVRYGGKDIAPIADAAMQAKTVREGADMLRDYLLTLATGSQRNDVLIDMANKMIEKSDKAESLMSHGYAPLSRFGTESLDVVDAKGERVYFGLFESKSEASKMARRMVLEFPGATIRQGTTSEEAYKMFAGVSPETLELFGEMLGLENDGTDAASQAFQEYLKLARSSRSAMKRLIQRKGIAGFSEDPGRVLAGFIYSNARQTSGGLHMGDIGQAVNDIPQGQGELKDAAMKLADYIKNPQEEAQKFRGLLFAQYLGGSVASAMVNMTQPLTVTFPYLSQFGGVVKAASQMKRAASDVMKNATGDKALDAALKLAEEQGIVAPQEVHQLMAQANGSGSLRAGDGTTLGNASAQAGNALAKLSLVWGKLFSSAEQFNRRLTFIASYRTAIEQKIPNPAAFAEKVIAETQFTYNKGSKPRWARGAIGGTLFTFKQYSINYLELASRMATQGGPEGKKAALLMIAVLFLMGGAGGLPFAEDAEDIADGIMQRLGYNFSAKQKRNEFFADLLGKEAAKFLDNGLSGLPGVPIDLSGRMGMGNLIPMTGILTKKTDYSRDIMELAGPAGDLVKRGFESANALAAGDIGKAGKVLLPVAGRNVVQALDMANTGMYRDQRGKKVLDVDGYDALAKAIGFQPNDVARVQEASRAVQILISQNKIREAEIADKWAQGMFLKDPDTVASARAMLKDWNDKNPESPMKIQLPQILKRVRAMNMSKQDRIAKTAPKEIRAAVKKELTE